MYTARLVAAAGLAVILLVAASASAETFLVRSVLGCGGAQTVTAGHRLVSTAGQTVVGTVQGSGYVHRIGFWPGGDGIATAILPRGAPGLPGTPSLRLRGANPFPTSTWLEYGVPVRSPVRVALYDIAGRQVRLLHDDWVEAGIHRLYVASTGLASGVYLCRMTTPGATRIQKLVLLQ